MSTDLREQAKNLPTNPGVYLFRQGDKVLYVGKATSLRDRVRSYFTDDLLVTRNAKVLAAVEEADHIEYRETDSVLEALILEANLIKQYMPPGNTSQKDDKTYSYVVITREEFPRVFTVRGRELQTVYDPDEFKYVFGPFIYGRSLRQALHLIRKIFPFRGIKDPVELKKTDSPLRQQMGLTPDFSRMDKKEYGRLIQNLRLFFEGKKGQLVKNLEKEMKEAAQEQRFEEAARVRNTIEALKHVHDTSLLTDDFFIAQQARGFMVEAYDVAHTMGESMVGVMVVVADGHLDKSRYRKFKIKRYKSSNDTGALKEVLERRLKHDEWPLPHLIAVDGGKAQFNAAKGVLDKYGIEIPIVAVTKNEKHQPSGYVGDQTLALEHEKEILLANSEAHRFAITWHRQKQRKRRFE